MSLRISAHAKKVATAAKLSTEDNLGECLVRAKAESNKAGAGTMFYAWNRVIHALWDVQKLRREDTP